MRALFLVLALWLPGAASAQDPPDANESDFDPERASAVARRALVTNLHVGELRVALGGHVDIGRPGLDPRGGFHLAAGLDAVTNEVLGARLRAFSFDFVWNQGSGATLFMPTLLRIDYLFFGAQDGSVCPAPFLTLWPATHCDPESGYVGFGGSLIGYMHDTEDSRNALRVGEVYAAFSFPPAFDEAFAERRVPILVGASLDYLWGNLRGDTQRDRWVGRALLALDAAVRFSDFRGAFEGRVTYRPSFTEWVGDFGVEVMLRILFEDFHTAFRPQGNLVRLVLELGYAHWSIPERSAGLTFGSAQGWAGVGRDSLFLRIGFEPVLVHVP